MKTIFILLIALYSNINPQNILSEFRIIDEKQNIEFGVSYESKTYHMDSDTIEMKYSINNKSNNIIYIFDPKYLYDKVVLDEYLDTSSCIYEFNLGGTWFYDPGYSSFMMLKEIQAHSTFTYEFKLIITSHLTRTKKLQYINSKMDSENVRKEYVGFNIGYIIKSGDFNVIIKDSDYTDFQDTEDGIYFDANLTRLSLGPVPLCFYVKNE